MLLVWMLFACFIYISYLGYYIYILGWLIGWIPAVSLADARSFIADDYPIRPTLWLVDDLHTAISCLEAGWVLLCWLTSVDAGKQVGGIQLDSSKKNIICYLFDFIYIHIWCVKNQMIENWLIWLFKISLGLNIYL